MNDLCVKPILSTSGMFVYLANSNAPSGSNYDLYPDYLTRWNTFKTTNASVLNSSQIEMIYVCDEPTWNGLTFGELDTICTTIKNDFPDIPLIFVEGWPTLSKVQVPTTVDWIGFDHYGIADVSTDTTYLAWLDTLKSKRSTPNQRIMLVFDNEWNSSFWPAGWQPDTMEQVFEHYYDLAMADTNIIGLAGFTWPGIAPGWLGARSLPQNVIDKTAQIGQLIKANYDPCNTTAIQESETKIQVKVYPNPSSGNFIIERDVKFNRYTVVNMLGEKIYDKFIFGYPTEINLSGKPKGIYILELQNAHNFDSSERIKLVMN